MYFLNNQIPWPRKEQLIKSNSLYSSFLLRGIDEIENYLKKELVRKDTIHLTKLIVGIGKDQ